MKMLEMAPIDFGWEQLETVKTAICKLASEVVKPQNERACFYYNVDFSKFVSDFEMCVHCLHVHQKGRWSNREDPRLFWLPKETGIAYGFLFKVNENGTTFAFLPEGVEWIDYETKGLTED